MSTGTTEPRVIRHMMQAANVSTKTELRRTIKGMPYNKRIRWAHCGVTSPAELARCHRYAQIIDMLREVNYGVPASAIADCVDEDLIVTWRDCKSMTKDGMLIEEKFGKQIGRARIAALYWLVR